jgi:hypothetical protein
MRIDGYDDELRDEEQVIEEFLGDNPRARELRLMRAALEQRLAVMQRDYDRLTGERERTQLHTKITELRKQIAAIHQEEAITTFVEDSVRVTLHKSALDDMI